MRSDEGEERKEQEEKEKRRRKRSKSSHIHQGTNGRKGRERRGSIHFRDPIQLALEKEKTTLNPIPLLACVLSLTIVSSVM